MPGHGDVVGISQFVASDHCCSSPVERSVINDVSRN
jgi:hypothetical protein